LTGGGRESVRQPLVQRLQRASAADGKPVRTGHDSAFAASAARIEPSRRHASRMGEGPCRWSDDRHRHRGARAARSRGASESPRSHSARARRVLRASAGAPHQLPIGPAVRPLSRDQSVLDEHVRT
jgi:hypothetical protein